MSNEPRSGSPRGGRSNDKLGGVIHTYQRYDPQRFPSPRTPPPDLASAAFEHMLRHGSTRRLTGDELARAIRIDPSQIAGLGPSLESMIEMLEERKRRILETYETDTVLDLAARTYAAQANGMQPPEHLSSLFDEAVRDEQIVDLERLWYAIDDEQSRFARDLLHLRERLGEKYEVEQLASSYQFTGATPLDVPTAIDIKEELEAIDRLLEQLREAMKNAQIAVIDMEELARFVDDAGIDQLQQLGEQIREYLEQEAERQGLEAGPSGIELSPQAYKIFQGKLLDEIFSSLDAARSGRHQGPVVGEGAVELPTTKPYEFGDSIAHIDAPQSFVNSMIRTAGERRKGEPVRLTPDDIEIHRTRNNPKCATVVLMDMSGSMRYDGQYINVKRMALALHALIRTEYPGDYIQFVEVYSFAKVRHITEIPSLMPKPVTIRDPMVHLRVDMSDDRVLESMVHPHFTNIQRGLALARQLLAPQDTPNRQVILLTDGLPTAHFSDEWLYLMYPPNPLTEEATMREAHRCAAEGITINTILLPSWWQSEEDVAFGYRLAESTKGRVLFAAGNDLSRFVVWDYVNQRRKIIG